MIESRQVLAFVASLTFVAGCSSGKDGASTVPVTIGIEPWEVQAGEDRIWCRTLKVPSDVTLDVNSATVTMTPGSHHFILYRSTADLADGFGDCLEMNDRTFVLGSQTPGNFEFGYPEGLAVPLFAGEQLILESHYSNASDNPVTAEVSVELRTIPHENVTDYVQTVLAGFGFSIPPNTPEYTDGDSVDEVPGLKILSLSSHTHKRATEFTIDRVTPSETTRIYTSYDWESPAIAHFDPPLAGESGNTLDYACTWFNDTDQPITFGPTTEDEMCLMVVTFYPAISYSP